MIRTRAEAEAHQRKHGFLKAMGDDPDYREALEDALKKRRRMTKPEREYGLILETQKRAGEIISYRFEGMRLKWGENPKTGLAMYYKPDFTVFLPTTAPWQLKVVEVKGPWISERDMVRFKGCRAEWPEIIFEMHQRDKEGRWTKIQ